MRCSDKQIDFGSTALEFFALHHARCWPNDGARSASLALEDTRGGDDDGLKWSSPLGTRLGGAVITEKASYGVVSLQCFIHADDRHGRDLGEDIPTVKDLTKGDVPTIQLWRRPRPCACVTLLDITMMYTCQTSSPLGSRTRQSSVAKASQPGVLLCSCNMCNCHVEIMSRRGTPVVMRNSVLT
jgi:hypothetical protein